VGLLLLVLALWGLSPMGAHAREQPQPQPQPQLQSLLNQPQEQPLVRATADSERSRGAAAGGSWGEWRSLSRS